MIKNDKTDNLKKISATLILAIAMGLTVTSALNISGYQKLGRKNTSSSKSSLSSNQNYLT